MSPTVLLLTDDNVGCFPARVDVHHKPQPETNRFRRGVEVCPPTERLPRGEEVPLAQSTHRVGLSLGLNL
jgi:hypothetical protein